VHIQKQRQHVDKGKKRPHNRFEEKGRRSIEKIPRVLLKEVPDSYCGTAAEFRVGKGGKTPAWNKRKGTQRCATPGESAGGTSKTRTVRFTGRRFLEPSEI